MYRSARFLGILVLVLGCLCIVVWSAALRDSRRGILTVRFLDVGQGDAILIDAPSGRRVLIDGGPANGGLMRRLGAALPWWNRSIDLVIPTHPDADHIAGLISVLRRYQVGMVLQSSVLGSTPIWDTLEEEITHSGAALVVAERGQIVDLGVGAYMEVLSPDRSVPTLETNTACVVVRLVFGATSFMLSCDAPQAVEKYLVSLDGRALHADVLKAGHHGSRTSSAPLFVGLVDPRWVVYSRACNNTYGFPHAETEATFARFGMPALDTCVQGEVGFKSDGSVVVLHE